MKRHLYIRLYVAAIFVLLPAIFALSATEAAAQDGRASAETQNGRASAETRQDRKISTATQTQDRKTSVAAQPQDRKTFDRHVVKGGETAYSIARNYGISLTTLIEDNPEVDPTLLPIGLELNIRKAERGETKAWEITREWQQVRDTANQDGGDGYIYHLVAPGETLYSIGREFGVPVDKLVEINHLQNSGLRANSIIRIPADSEVAAKTSATATAPLTGAASTVPLTASVPTTAPADTVHPSFGADYVENQAVTGGHGEYFRPFEGTPNIALMLPLDGTTAAGNDFTEFYRGALIALEDLRAKGRSANVTLYNTAHSADKVFDIVSSPEFSSTNLMIGPIYESEMASAVQFADAYGVPIVSPLAAVREFDSEMLYQMAPTPTTKYDKLRPLLGLRQPGWYGVQDSLLSSKNVILVSSLTGNDKEFEGEITQLLESSGVNFGHFMVGSSGDISTLLDWNRENVLIVLAATELAVDKALATISTHYNNASVRRNRKTTITVVGSSKWVSHTTIDKNLYFKLNVCFVTSYYIERSGAAAKFEGRFLEAYGEFPTRAAFRGYDALTIFAEALFAGRQGRQNGLEGASRSISVDQSVSGGGSSVVSGRYGGQNDLGIPDSLSDRYGIAGDHGGHGDHGDQRDSIGVFGAQNAQGTHGDHVRSSSEIFGSTPETPDRHDTPETPGQAFEARLKAAPMTPLRTPYHFIEEGYHKRHVNDQWTLVRFTSDFNISVK